MDNNEKANAETEVAAKEKLHCGLVMPISGTNECTPEHWSEVRGIITEAVRSIQEPTFDVAMVSESEDVGVIHKKIVQNLYNADIVICDVSAKNPNVMFELGMRLAFDKPTIIVKDDKTDYSFDTSVIEHIGYPRDLRFGRMVTFKQTLVTKVLGTYNQAKADPNHSTFLKNFGQFKVANLDQTEVTANEAILEAIAELQNEVSAMRSLQRRDLRERKNSMSESDLMDRIRFLIEEFKSKSPESDIDLSNPEFMNFLEHRLNAQAHFNSKPSFERFVKQAIAVSKL
ncbi:hypothetical protein [Burkholderia cepacia]|uniref:hypothetical protein n=1 Tax=Burkholderia cepacia TaxID=292 RepID=UPI003527C2DF